MTVNEEMDTSDDSSKLDTDSYDTDQSNSPLDLSIKRIHLPQSNQESSTLTEICLLRPSHIYAKPTISDLPCEAPRILTQPKSEWHYRSLKDLAKKHIPYISGDGPQRTPIRVKVPQKYTQKMYLCVRVITLSQENHESKVIVPPRTTVMPDDVTHENNLYLLNFDQCCVTDYFEQSSRNVYLEITPDEHKNELKEVRVHMFNLYQNQWITKEMIEAKQLDSCKLAFSLCIKENQCYIPISKSSYSSIIQEKKLNSKSRVQNQTFNQLNSSSPDSSDF